MNWIYICYVEESRPLWSSGQSSWLHNGDVLCFLWGTNGIYICYVAESRPPLWSRDQSSWLQIERSGFDSLLKQTKATEFNKGVFLVDKQFTPALSIRCFFFSFEGWSATESTVAEATSGLLYQLRMTDDDGCAGIGGMTSRGNRSTGRKPIPVPLCPPQIPYDLTWARTGPPPLQAATNLLSYSTSFHEMLVKTYPGLYLRTSLCLI
jgi:hypothetical protein